MGIRVQESSTKSDASLAADILTSVAVLTACILSLLTQKRSLRPSTILTLYLSTLVLFGIARTRTLWLLSDNVGTRRAAVSTLICLACAVAALVFESIGKWDSTRDQLFQASPDRKGIPTPEQFAGFWSRASFTWLVATLRRGYTKVISLDDLPALDSKLASERLLREFDRTWKHCTLQFSASLSCGAG